MSLQHTNSCVYSASYSTVHTTFLYDYFFFFQQRIRNRYSNVHAVGAGPKRPTENLQPEMRMFEPESRLMTLTYGYHDSILLCFSYSFSTVRHSTVLYHTVQYRTLARAQDMCNIMYTFLTFLLLAFLESCRAPMFNN